MVTLTDSPPANSTKKAIEEALNKAASKVGAPEVVISEWDLSHDDPLLVVIVNGKRRVLEVSEPFLEDEPDSEAYRKIGVATKALVEVGVERWLGRILAVSIQFRSRLNGHASKTPRW